MNRIRSLFAALAAAALAACGGGGGLPPGSGFDARAPFTASAAAEGTLSLLSDAAPTATVDGRLVLVRGRATTPLANGAAETEVFLTFPLPEPADLPAVHRFDDPLLGGPAVYGRFDLVVNGVRDEHESVRDAEQPAGSGFIVVTARTPERVAGTFAFRAAAIGEHHEDAAGAKHGPPDVGHGDERLDVSGAFDAPLSEGEIAYERAGETVHPHAEGGHGG